ncbi:histidine kinase [Pedobacter sp. PLR]|uniref:sensor histidine kinase n=1 Tax=Pedobacter sp. PLR TaxID=2994465 RepID=UPI0022471615|nr:histidine kinase [Pedobacter sp. PLR]MCX2454169.1 histidine kinase [Pedobacter sp. PLR]
MLNHTNVALRSKNKRIPSLKDYKVHVLAWTLFMLYESLAIWLATEVSVPIISYLIHYLVNITLFYLNTEIILPLALKKHRHHFWEVPLIILLEVSIYLVVNFQFISGGLWRGTYFIGFAVGYYFLQNFLKERKAKEDLEKQALEQLMKEKEKALELTLVKNAYLQAQISPHFLFNTLTFIYSNLHKPQPKEAHAVILLTKIMRYAIESNQEAAQVPLSKEIEQVENLIRLVQIKQKERLAIFLDYDPKIKLINFIPMVLVTLTENIFKHGNLSETDHPATITIKLTATEFEIKTVNLINSGVDNTGSHSGLDNIRQRLLYTYGPEAVLSYCTRSDNHFEAVVSLPVKLLQSI